MVEDANGSMFRHGIFSSYSGAEITPVIDMPGRIDNPIVIGEIHTISYSTHSEIVPVRLLSSRRVAGFSRGPRTVAGTLIFTVFEQDVVRKLAPEYMNGILIDEMPPFNINVVCKNDSGAMSRYAILGVRLVDSGMVMSVDNIITENTISYIAEDMIPLHIVQDGAAYAGGVFRCDDAEGAKADLVAGGDDSSIVLPGVAMVPDVEWDKIDCAGFLLRVDVLKRILPETPGGEADSALESASPIPVTVYKAQLAAQVVRHLPIELQHGEQLLAAMTDNVGVVRCEIPSTYADGSVLHVVIAVQWYDGWHIKPAELTLGECTRATVILPPVLFPGFGGGKSGGGGAVGRFEWPGGTATGSPYVAYGWMKDIDGASKLMALADMTKMLGFMPLLAGFQYAVNVRGRCYYTEPGQADDLSCVPVNGLALRARLNLFMSYDTKTPYLVGYSVPISDDGTVSAEMQAVGFLRHAELEYLPEDYVPSSADVLPLGYYYGAFHAKRQMELREIVGTRDRPGALDLGNLVFDGVTVRQRDNKIFLTGMAFSDAGGCPVGARVAVQLRWGEAKGDKCYSAAEISDVGVWQLSFTLPVDASAVQRMYIEYIAPSGFAAREPYQVDGVGIIPGGTAANRPFNVMGLLGRSHKDPQLVFYRRWPDEYPNGMPSSEECSAPATVRISGHVAQRHSEIPVANAVVCVSFMAMTKGGVMQPFSRYAVTDSQTGRFELQIPANKQLLKISVHAVGTVPFIEEWPYLEGDPAKYAPEYAVAAEQRRLRVEQLKSGSYDVDLDSI